MTTQGPWEIVGNHIRVDKPKHPLHHMEIAKIAMIHPEWQTNAQLMARAPEMYRELREIKEMFDRKKAVRGLKGYEQARWDSIWSLLESMEG